MRTENQGNPPREASRHRNRLTRFVKQAEIESPTVLWGQSGWSTPKWNLESPPEVGDTPPSDHRTPFTSFSIGIRLCCTAGSCFGSWGRKGRLRIISIARHLGRMRQALDEGFVFGRGSRNDSPMCRGMGQSFSLRKLRIWRLFPRSMAIQHHQRRRNVERDQRG